MRFDYAGMIRDISAGRSDDQCTPYIAVDECSNNAIVKELVLSLCNQGLASGAGPLWNQQRTRADRSIYYAWGGLSKDVTIPWERGVPTKGVGWNDENVVAVLIGQLLGGLPVVLQIGRAHV